MDQEHRQVSNKLIKITCMSLLFMAIELIGGYLANSIAIFADAFHLLSDVLAYLISLGAVWLSTRPNPPSYLTFGWEKAEPLGALVNVIIIYIVTGELFIEATKRMINKEVVDEPKYMLITSIFGLFCNLIIMSILHNDPHGGHHGCSHGHSHGESHSHHHHELESCSSAHSHSHQHTQHSNCGHNHNSEPHHHHFTTTGNPHQHSPEEQEHHHHHDKSCSHNHEHHHQQIVESHKECSHGREDRNSGDELQDNLRRHKHKCAKDEVFICGSLNSDEQIHVREEPPKKIKNINLQAAYIHILTDIILSIGVIISALIIYFLAPDHHTWSAWQLADPLCTYLFSFLAIWSTWPILKESVLLLLDASHNEQLLADLRHDITELTGVKELVDLKVWSTNRTKHYGAVRVRVDQREGCWRVKQLLRLRGVTGFVEVQEETGLKESI